MWLYLIKTKSETLKIFQRIFGSLCFSRVPNQRKRKLQDKSEPMILVGYHPTSGYRMYEPVKYIVVISRDAIVVEIDFWDWKNKSKSLPQISSSILDELGNQTDEEVITETNIIENQLQPRRLQRNSQLPLRFVDHEVFPYNAGNNECDLVHFSLFVNNKPLNLEESMKKQAWKKAMIEELRSIEKNQTWELINLPPDKHPIIVKWVYKLKWNPDGLIIKHKERLVAKGFFQRK